MKFDKALCLNLMAEFVGSAMYMSIGCMGENLIDANYTTGIAFGCSMVLVYQCFHSTSGGHANPSVTCAAVILNKLKWWHGLLYMLMHILGTPFGFIVAYIIIPHKNYFERGSQICCQSLKNGISIGGALAIEFIASCAYMFAWCSALDDRNLIRQDSMSLRLGLSLTCTTIAASFYAGGAANILRSLIPALASEYWDNLWIFLVAPIIPSIAIPFLWRYVMMDGPDTDKGTEGKSGGILGEIK